VTTDNSRPYATQHITTPVTAGNSTYADRHRNDYQRVGPLHDMSRQERQDRQDAENGHSSRDSSLPHLLHPQQMHSENPHVTNAQQAAQLALSHPVSARPRTTQKEEMLAGRHYFPFDKELVLERERCNGACWRFNSSTNPNNGVSPEERARLFRDILQPREHVISPTQASPVTPIGRVGDNVVVEAPFNCDYGYNISIGQEVAIGKNCTILDTCEVKIGDRCNIGPNVNIYTATLPVDPKRRLGSRGPNLGRKITIDNDCWIGGGVTILPGRTIGKGSTVGAGSIVTRVSFLGVQNLKWTCYLLRSQTNHFTGCTALHSRLRQSGACHSRRLSATRTMRKFRNSMFLPSQDIHRTSNFSICNSFLYKSALGGGFHFTYTTSSLVRCLFLSCCVVYYTLVFLTRNLYRGSTPKIDERGGINEDGLLAFITIQWEGETGWMDGWVGRLWKRFLWVLGLVSLRML